MHSDTAKQTTRCQATAVLVKITKIDLPNKRARFDIIFEVTVAGCPEKASSSGELYFTLVLHPDDGSISREDKNSFWTNIRGAHFSHTYSIEYGSDVNIIDVEAIKAECSCN